MRKLVPPAFVMITAALLAAAAPFAPAKASPRPPRIGIDTTFGDHVQEARRLFGLKHYREAIGKIDLALAMQPDDKNAAILYALRGHCFWNLDGDQRAFADYSEAIRRDANVPGVRGRRGILAFNRGDVRAAIVDLTAALRERQKDPAYFYHARALAFLSQGKGAQARKDFEKVTQLPAQQAQGYFDRAESFLRIGDAAHARRDFRTARRLDPASVYMSNGLAWLQATWPVVEFRNGKEAVRNATHACRLTDWKNPDMLDTLAAAYAELGDFGQAVNYERQAMGLESVPAKREVLKEHLARFTKNQPVREELTAK